LYSHGVPSRVAPDPQELSQACLAYGSGALVLSRIPSGRLTRLHASSPRTGPRR